MLKKIYVLWIDTLATALLQMETLLRHHLRFQLRANFDPLKLYIIEDPEPKLIYAFDSQKADALPQPLLARTRGGTIEISVPAAAVQERTLDVLPAESLPYVERIVLNQIESLFPWPAADILHSTKIESRADGRLDVFVRATSRSAIGPALAAASACGPDEILIVEESGDKRGNPISVLIDSGKKRHDRARLFAQYAVILLLGVSTCVLGWTSFVGWTLASDVAALDQAINDRRAVIKRSTQPKSAVADRGIEAKKKNGPLAVVVLDELSSILPDDTYLTEFTLESGHLRISGVTTNAAELVPLLESSGDFTNAAFAAPTTRIAGGPTERFSIDAVVMPPSVAKP
jgi:general secretion pathway protein L